MKKDLGAKTYMHPLPVLILAAYNEDGTPNAMNAAFGGFADYGVVFISVSRGHKTVQNILARKALTISMGTEEYMTECDYVGIASGNNVPNKLEISGFTTTKSAHVDAPIINELPLTLECELISYSEDGLMLAKIVNTSADESILNENGEVDRTKYHPIAYDPVEHSYYKLGETIGEAFSVGKKLIK